MAQKRKNAPGKGRKGQPHSLSPIQPNAAGIDLGSREHCVAGPPLPDGSPNVKHFGTTTPELLRLAGWLEQQKIATVAMESTGVYWIPLFEILDSRGFDVQLVNARQISHVPGRKTDMIDCQWIQLLHACGLLRGSFRPGEDICCLRALIRERNTIVDQRSDWVRRMQKSLDQMNICVHHAVSDITGLTGMAIIRAIISGERDPRALASLRDCRCQKSEDRIAEELTGNWRLEHLFNLGKPLRFMISYVASSPTMMPRSSSTSTPCNLLTQRIHRRRLRHPEPKRLNFPSWVRSQCARPFIACRALISLQLTALVWIPPPLS